MNFNQLKYIVAVDKHRNFSRAADECEIAQSTLSKEIQRLEQEFNVMIFDRSRRPVTPTLKGIDLLKITRQILKGEKDFVDTALKRDNRPAGDFRLGILPMLAPYLLPLFIRNLSHKYPELKVEVLELSEQGMLHRFQKEEIDGGISISPFIEPGYYEENLFEENFVVYADAQNPILKKTEVDWNDLPFDEIILHETFEKHLLLSGEWQQDRTAKEKMLKNTHYESGSLETIRKIIDVNGGITLLPELSTLYMGDRRKKQVRPITGESLRQSILFVTPRGFEKNRITKVIKREILNGLPK